MQQDSKARWASCQKYFEQSVGKAVYDNLFAHVTLEAYKIADKTLILQVPNEYICEQIEKHYLDVLRVALFNTFGKIRLCWDIRISDNASKKQEANDETNAPDQSILAAKKGLQGKEQQAPAVAPGSQVTHNLPPIDSQLNTDQTFRTFVEGDSNKLSRSIGLNVAEHPQGTLYNPMFIFGPSGCGKTHLVNAIGNHCKKIFPDKRVLYVSARNFQVQFTTALRNDQINDFIGFYQTIDMLIVDDIQEWMSSPKTQDTFFHIFNHLYRNNRRIILVSDRSPAQLEGMHERLLTRFKGGMTAEMEKPNYQLCIEIMKKKVARDGGARIPDDVLRYIAETANGSVRELEGVITSLCAYSIVYNSPINMKLVDRVLKRAVKTDNMPLTVDDILDCVCRHYEVTTNAVKSHSRKRELVIPRQLTMFLTKKYTNIPTSRIGKLIGSRDHSTVLHSISRIEELVTKDPAFVEKVSVIEKDLKIKK